MQIFIPTMGRLYEQRTRDALVAAGCSPALVVPWNEAKAYASLYSGVIRTPQRISGIAMTRQWIMDNSSEDHIVMMDDDLSFHKRRADDPTKFVRATPADVKFMVRDIDHQLKKFAHVGVLAREGGNRITDPYRDCTRPLRVYAYNMRRVRAAGAKYHPGLVQDDFDMTLQLLRAGLPNRVICSFVNDQGGSHATGGASSYRTIESHNASVRKLAEIHAPFVRVVKKPALKSGGWDGQPRLDVVISWKKALADANQRPR